MFQNIGLIEAFKDTERRVRETAALREATLQMQAGTMLYMRKYEAVSPKIKTENPDISVVEDTTFHCAQLNRKDPLKTAVLNFANAYRPGGGVLDGARAQEECLCRSSNLYSALTLPYLLYNYYKWNDKNTGQMGSDSVIYSPGVTVFKSDDLIPKMLEEWFQADVLTCAAPYNDPDRKKPVSEDTLRDVFYNRIRNILEVAAANDVDILILGAFGCGAFHNPPELVAEEFHHLLVGNGYGRFFRKVIFAIKRNDQDNPNLRAFQKVFNQIKKEG